jgi:hypothetical protein
MSEPFGSPEASWKASRMVRKGGLGRASMGVFAADCH